MKGIKAVKVIKAANWISKSSLPAIFCVALGAAQPAPPAPAPHPEPALAPLPPVPPLPPLPPVLELDGLRFEIDGIADEARRMAADIAASVRDNVKVDMEAVRQQVKQATLFAQNFDRDFKFEWKPGGSEDGRYREGTRLLDDRKWDRAVDVFSEIVSRGGSRADGALYWKAYALHKLGRRPEAQTLLAELAKTYPNSGWLNDSKALSVEISQAAGQPVSPESQDDDELKLIALNGLVNSDPERAVPLIEKLLSGSHSPKMKERALFVLAQSGSVRGREALTQIARGKSNPDLQLRALRYLGTAMKGKESRQVLGEIYSSATSVEVKREILRGFMSNGDREQVVNAAKTESAPELRREAIRLMGEMRADAELWQMYQGSAADMKQEILRAMAGGGNSDKLLEILKTDKDSKLRLESIRALQRRDAAKNGEAIAALYPGEADAEVKKEILRAMARQNNVKILVDLARKETDPALKREAVQNLSRMKSKEATDFLLEVLGNK